MWVKLQPTLHSLPHQHACKVSGPEKLPWVRSAPMRGAVPCLPPPLEVLHKGMVGGGTL